MSHCIFVREYVGSKARPPVMLAYDIPDRDDAEALVQSIARSYSANGIDPRRRIHWFYQGDRLHEIYIWPQGGIVAVATPSSAHEVEERYTGRREHVPAPSPRQQRHRLRRRYG